MFRKGKYSNNYTAPMLLTNFKGTWIGYLKKILCRLNNLNCQMCVLNMERQMKKRQIERK